MTGIWTRPAGRYFTNGGDTKLARLLRHYEWTETPQANDADLLLLGSPRHLSEVTRRPNQRVDCVAGTEQLTHKANLARLLRADPRTAALQPETYLVDESPLERARLAERARAEPDAVWIRKPVARGRGIGVQVLTDVEGFLRESAERAHGSELVQRYIEQPLLLEGTKSEVRSYVLVASTDPLLVLYHDGTVRLTSLPYETGDWSNPLRHVTNTYRQKEASASLWSERGDALKWTLGRLGQDVHARGLTDDPQWIDRRLRPALIGMLHQVFAVAAPHLRPQPGAFQLLGMDTIIEGDLEKLWLTEIQLGPGLSIDNPVKATLIPSMLQEAVSIALEVHDRIEAGLDPTELSSRRHFRWVYRGQPVTG
ncbi:MAG: hypothetical protein AAF799_21475 [Myxococcota bacterium]